MTWIKTIPPQEAGPDLRAVYEAVYGLYPADYMEEVPAVRRPNGGSERRTTADRRGPTSHLGTGGKPPTTTRARPGTSSTDRGE